MWQQSCAPNFSKTWDFLQLRHIFSAPLARLFDAHFIASKWLSMTNRFLAISTSFSTKTKYFDDSIKTNFSRLEKQSLLQTKSSWRIQTRKFSLHRDTSFLMLSLPKYKLFSGQRPIGLIQLHPRVKIFFHFTEESGLTGILCGISLNRDWE